jgi:hypothetical protein
MFVLLGLPTLTPARKANAASQITVPTDYPTIQAAIDASTSGDTIKVLRGTYIEQLTISKSLTLVGSGARITTIKAPTTLQPGITGNPNIVQVSDGSTVTMKGFTVRGTSGSSCGTSPGNGLVGVNVLEDATINIDSFGVRDCTFDAFRVGAPSFTPNGLQVGHATISRTDIDDYQFSGVEAFADGSTLAISRSKINAADTPITLTPVGIVSSDGAKSMITNNKITGNICHLSLCGPDYLNQFQGFGMLIITSADGTIVSHNDVSNNDVGIGIIEGSGCCKIDQNILRNNQFFSVVIQDGEQMVSNTIIFGGKVGVLAVAFSVDTVATLNRVIIVGTTTPTQELPVGASAEIVFAPRQFINTQSAATDFIPMSLPIPLSN